MHKTNIFDIQRTSFVDGPGIRTVVFFKGCNLRCKWCHNPESWQAQPQQAWYKNRCVRCGKCKVICPVGAIGDDLRADMSKCIACRRCIDECPTAARKLYGRTASVEEILPVLLADQDFFAISGGGVTFSGGECLLQPDVLTELLRGCRAAGVQTAIDTAGNAPWETIERVLPLTDLFLYDIKCLSPGLHKELTGVTNERILDNYMRIHAIAPQKLMVRIPVIPDENDSDEEMRLIAEFLGKYPPQNVELLPYHRLGVPKAEALGAAADPFAEPTDTHMDELKEIFAAQKLKLL